MTDNIIIRPARLKEVRPALAFAQKIFQQFVRPDADVTGIGDKEENIRQYETGQWLMFLALDQGRIVGMVCERDGCHIRKLYVDEAYHRQGIATTLMNVIVTAMKEQGAAQITLASSDHALPFYTRYGFVATGLRQNNNGLIFTPMAYEL